MNTIVKTVIGSLMAAAGTANAGQFFCNTVQQTVVVPPTQQTAVIPSQQTVVVPPTQQTVVIPSQQTVVYQPSCVYVDRTTTTSYTWNYRHDVWYDRYGNVTEVEQNHHRNDGWKVIDQDRNDGWKVVDQDRNDGWKVVDQDRNDGWKVVDQDRNDGWYVTDEYAVNNQGVRYAAIGCPKTVVDCTSRFNHLFYCSSIGQKWVAKFCPDASYIW